MDAEHCRRRKGEERSEAEKHTAAPPDKKREAWFLFLLLICYSLYTLWWSQHESRSESALANASISLYRGIFFLRLGSFLLGNVTF